MGRSTRLLLVLLLLPLTCLAQAVGTVVGLRGDVVIERQGQRIEALLHVPVEVGDRILTGNPGRVKLRFADGSVVIVGDDSQFAVSGLEVDAHGRRRDGRFVLDVGLISQTVAPGAHGSWRVSTPTAVTSVRGTAFVVEVDREGVTDVGILSGEVVVQPFDPSRRTRALPGIFGGNAVVLKRAAGATRCEAGQTSCASVSTWDAGRLRDIESRLDL